MKNTPHKTAMYKWSS